jgi:transcriptional regulator with XRE-family HTH domain
VNAGKRLSQRLRALIKEHKTTAEKVAFEAEISKSYLSAVLRCQKSPTVRTLEKIAGALEVEIKDLFEN